MPDPISDEELVGLRAWFVGSQPKSWAARLIGRLDAVTAERDALREVLVDAREGSRDVGTAKCYLSGDLTDIDAVLGLTT